MAAFRLSSPAFEHDAPLPMRHTADGENISPPLTWEGVPPGTKELVLITDDPDADEGVMTHWLVYGLLPESTSLPEGVPRSAVIEAPVELVQGLNEYGEVGYMGPLAPDERGPHRFFFRLVALDTELLDVPPGASRSELREAARGHELAHTVLVGIA